jgi:hypothetical protein
MISATHRDEIPSSGVPEERNTWQMNAYRTSLETLSKQAHDAGYNGLVKLKAFAGVPCSHDGRMYEFLVSGIPVVVTLEGEHEVTPPRPVKTQESTRPQKRTADARRALPNKKPDKVAKQRGSHLDDVSIVCQLPRCTSDDSSLVCQYYH